MSQRAILPAPMSPSLVTVPGQRIHRARDERTTRELTDLLARVADGDREAFSQVYDLTSDIVYGLALRVVRSPAMAEEVTQEVFIQIWELSRSFDPARGSVKSWVATLAHRRAVDAVRRSQSARDREERVSTEGADPDVADSAVTEDEHSRIRDALSTLSDLQYEAIYLAYYEGLTYREVAERLDVPLGTVKSRMRDGLSRLRETLGDDHG